jgi:hypothetical protein
MNHLFFFFFLFVLAIHVDTLVAVVSRLPSASEFR